MSELVTVEVRKSYGGRTVVDSVSISVETGMVVGLLGPNGAGKTTTFYMVVGLIKPDEGKVLLDSVDVTHLPMHSRALKGIGYLAQEPSVFRKLTVRENISSILEFTIPDAKRRKQRTDELLEELKVTHVADSAGYALSGGERRRVEIARALTTTPTFLLLDEPFAGVDPIAVAEIQKIIAYLKQKGLGILITDHNVRETLQITDHAYVMNRGKLLVEGGVEEITNNPDARKLYLGEAFSMAGVVPHASRGKKGGAKEVEKEKKEDKEE